MPASRRVLRPASTSPRARQSQNGILFPLDAVYARAGVRPPAVKAIAPDDIPAPYRSLLVQESTGRPVEMGAIRIQVDVFRERIRRQILDNEIPLGRLLRDGGVQYESRPKAFLAVTPNSEMMGVFWMAEPRTLYGRRTEIIHEGSKIGDIVEVLPLV